MHSAVRDQASSGTPWASLDELQSMPLDQLRSTLDATADGLSQAQAKQRLER